MCLTACAQKKGGERGPRMGGGMSVNKDSDSAFVALKNETLKKYATGCSNRVNRL